MAPFLFYGIELFEKSFCRWMNRISYKVKDRIVYLERERERRSNVGVRRINCILVKNRQSRRILVYIGGGTGLVDKMWKRATWTFFFDHQGRYWPGLRSWNEEGQFRYYVSDSITDVLTSVYVYGIRVVGLVEVARVVLPQGVNNTNQIRIWIHVSMSDQVNLVLKFVILQTIQDTKRFRSLINVRWDP